MIRFYSEPVALFDSYADYQPYDVIISEIMADPVPSRSLPELEYLELFNRSDKTINLSDWTLTAGNHKIVLPDKTLDSNDYMVITDYAADSVPGYKDFIKVAMPHITNTGQVITLRDPAGMIIHSVDFSDDWYNEPGKDEGGWSVEIIDPENPCGGKINWKASIDDRGGTPGNVNSVFSRNPDNLPPLLLNASLNSDTSLILHFNESLHLSSYEMCNLYSVDKGMYHPLTVCATEPVSSDIVLQYTETFKPDITYTVTILDDLKDCAGNHVDNNVFAHFAFPEPAAQTDLIINEILFESDIGLEYVEIYNRSEKVIDLSSINLSLASESGTIYKTIRLTDSPYSIFPANFIVITRNAINLINCYKITSLQSVLEQKSLFSLPDDKGLLVVSDTAGNTIDECQYSKNSHFDILSDANRISLERCDPDKPSYDPDNWHTASALSGFGTPGYLNSQVQSATMGDRISLTSEMLSPDADGVDDEIVLHLEFTEPGWVGTIGVYTQEGHKIKTLSSNSLIGTHADISWDGKDENGNIAEIGVYILYGELYCSRGMVKNFKKVVSVVRK